MNPGDIKRLQRTLKRILSVCVLAGVAWGVWKYDLDSIPAGYDHLLPQRMPAGAKIVTMAVDDATVIGVGSVVIYLAPGYDEGVCFGVVAGIGGESIEVEKRGDGRARVSIGGRVEQLEIPAGAKLTSGVVPLGHYVILNGDRHLFSGSLKPDSRIVGPIPADRIVKKVVTPLYFF